MNEEAPENIDPSEAQTPSEAAEIGLQARVDQLEKQVHDYKLLIAEFENSRRRLLARRGKATQIHARADGQGLPPRLRHLGSCVANG